MFRSKDLGWRKAVSCVIALTFFLSSIVPPRSAFAQGIPLSVLNLPSPGTMVMPTSAFMPAVIKGVRINPDNPLELNFIVNTGESELRGEELRAEADKLIKYFMASLTVPEDELWVNLSPYEEDRIVSDSLGSTEMGRDMLAQDYLLKQLTASLVYPEEQLGKEFWQRVHKKANELYGTTDIPVNTFNKIWIMPDKAVVYEYQNTAFVLEKHLKVMLEEDYLALQENIGSEKFGTDVLSRQENQEINEVSSAIIREVLIPEIEKEVNEGKTFANLRQIYNSLILATWFKQALKDSLLGQVYVDQNKVAGIELEDKEIKQKIYDQYLEAFRVGVYDFIKEDIDPSTNEIVPRKYFSGGLDNAMMSKTLETVRGEPHTLPAQYRRAFERNVVGTGADFAVLVNNLEIGTAADTTEVDKARKGTPDGAMLADDIGAAIDLLSTSGVARTSFVNTLIKSLNRQKILDDFAESVGISAKDTLEIMVAVGIARKDESQSGPKYALAHDFFAAEKIELLRDRLINASQNPPLVDLSTIRLERILVSAVDARSLMAALAKLSGSDIQTVIDQLQRRGVLGTLVATWKMENALAIPGEIPELIEANDLVSTEDLDGIYQENGINVEFSLPSRTEVTEDHLDGVLQYQIAMESDLDRGQFNYRGTGTRQTIEAWFNGYFVPEVYEKVREYINAQFNNGRTLQTIITNGIGANDQFMWALVEMYNRNRPEGAPVWIHVITARDLEGLELDPESTLAIHISRSGSTWEGVEVASRLSARGVKKMIVVANGGALKAIADSANRDQEGIAMQVGMQPDIGGRNMHRKTPIYYLVQTIAGMYLPSMDAPVFAALNHQFDQANDFANRSQSLAILSGEFLHGLMKVKGVEHIAFISNSRQLALIGSEFSQYVMEGSNKEDIISWGDHDLTSEPEFVLDNLANSPAAEKTVALVLLDQAAENYYDEARRVQALQEKMPMMVFSFDSREDPDFDGVTPKQQAAFDILWTDFITVLTTLLRVDANSNPNVKVVRALTADYVSRWQETARRYETDKIGAGETDLLVSFGVPGSPQSEAIGTQEKQMAINSVEEAATQGVRLADELAASGMISGRDRLNIFAGTENVRALMQALRNQTYRSALLQDAGWITETGLYPGRAHKGHEATLAYSQDPRKPLLANKTVNFFLNQRELGDAEGFNEPFVNTTGLSAYDNVVGATIHQTNDSMTFPNIQRTAQVSPTVLFEFRTLTPEVDEKIRQFYAAFVQRLGDLIDEDDQAMAAILDERLLEMETAYAEPETSREILDAYYGELMQAGELSDRARAIGAKISDRLIEMDLARPDTTVSEENADIAMMTAAEFQELETALHSIVTSYRADTTQVRETARQVMEFSRRFNYVDYDNASEEQVQRFDEILVKKSRFARDLALDWAKRTEKSSAGYAEFVDALLAEAMADIQTFASSAVASGRIEKKSADDSIASTKRLLPEWLSQDNNIPYYVVAGLIRAILEGRSEDILYAFGKGWRVFGTAGIRNPAFESSFGAITDLELREFSGQEEGIAGHHAPILTGPNFMNVVNFLQQERAIVLAYREIQAAFAQGDEAVQRLIKEKKLDPRFVEDVKNNKVSIAYDSRTNGKFYAHMLAAAFLRDGVGVDLFDRPAGVPAVVYQASENPSERSAIAILISASHSETNYNGFKAFLSVQRSQVDKAGKNIIVAQRGVIVGDSKQTVVPYKMQLELGSSSFEDFDRIFAEHAQGDVRLRWFGKTEFNPNTNRMGAEFDNNFYDRYYKHVQELSPVGLLGLNGTELDAVGRARQALKVFYTAFSGVGAINAQDFPGFLAYVGYEQVVLNENQTLEHDGSFSGFNRPRGNFGMPDPGVTNGWIVNFVEFLQQYAGRDFDIEKLGQAITLLNELDIGLSTDPDIDRAGIDLQLGEGTLGGNIKDLLIAAVEEILNNRGADATRISEITSVLKERLNDHLLLTANDAWSFIVFHKLRFMHERGMLDKNKLYIVEKSHVTTDALSAIAEYFRTNFGYNIYTVDTYVGFTELAKKSRDLFNIAQMSWLIHQHLAQEPDTTRTATVQVLLQSLKGLNEELKSNVMFQRRGVPLIDEAVSKLEGFVLQGQGTHEDTMRLLSIVAHLEIPMGVEESNGYGEFGVFVPNEDFTPEAGSLDWQSGNVGSMTKEHISEKDGSLAAFEFAELLALGRALENKTPFQMYLDLFRAIGAVGTDNRFIQYRGLTGDEKKLGAVKWFEQTFGVLLKRALDQGVEVTLFNGKYRLKEVQTYRDAKYDMFWIGFPEEGVRLFLENREGSTMYVTFRPSGTGANNRAYSWVFGAQSYKGQNVVDMDYEELNRYRMGVVDSLNELALDMFGVQGEPSGYAARDKENFVGLLSAMGEVNPEQYGGILAKVLDQPELAQGLSEDEIDMRDVADYYAKELVAYIDQTTGKIKKTDETLRTLQAGNRQAWDRFLASSAAQSYPTERRIAFSVNGEEIANIPQAYAMGWQTALVDYLIGKIEARGEHRLTLRSNDLEIAQLVQRRISSDFNVAIEAADVAMISDRKLQLEIRTIESEIERARKPGQLSSLPGRIKQMLQRVPSERDRLLASLQTKTEQLSRPADTSVVADVYGGIDFNPALLDLQIKRDGNGVPLPMNVQPIESMQIEGFLPIIINVTPISNLPLFLGMSDMPPPAEQAQEEAQDMPALSFKKFVLRERLEG